ncbi:hypothetical protein FD46_GL001170 [Liquorilactobacillus oeni DSM 19972]|uniref:Uncharacterized protein n=2 Tax=Liquorilactobacillus oeni TaxID=303241 RepID=A0A0R1MI48_9LACO|nr:hypothetical protein FD46_GL001170 [Liquorilactobacillus oeni DSM 19972]
MVYNFRLSTIVKKMRDKLGKKEVSNLKDTKNPQIQSVLAVRKKWTILSQFLFWISVSMAFYGSLSILIYFLNLYTVAMIYINHLNEKIIKEYGKA